LKTTSGFQVDLLADRLQLVLHAERCDLVAGRAGAVTTLERSSSDELRSL
jgi:hypothetical protein